MEKITFLYFTIFPYTHIYRSCGWWFLPKWADNCWWGEIGQSSHNSMRNLKYAGYFLTHAAHYLTQLGQDKQTPQPNLPIIRITQFMNWVHEWGPLPNTCGPLPNICNPLPKPANIYCNFNFHQFFCQYKKCEYKEYTV